MREEITAFTIGAREEFRTVTNQPARITKAGNREAIATATAPMLTKATTGAETAMITQAEVARTMRTAIATVRTTIPAAVVEIVAGEVQTEATTAEQPATTATRTTIAQAEATVVGR